MLATTYLTIREDSRYDGTHYTIMQRIKSDISELRPKKIYNSILSLTNVIQPEVHINLLRPIGVTRIIVQFTYIVEIEANHIRKLQMINDEGMPTEKPISYCYTDSFSPSNESISYKDMISSISKSTGKMKLDIDDLFCQVYAQVHAELLNYIEGI